jgi:hypothetical protein
LRSRDDDAPLDEVAENRCRAVGPDVEEVAYGPIGHLLALADMFDDLSVDVISGPSLITNGSPRALST